MSSGTLTCLGNLIRIKHGYGFESKYFSDSGSHIVLTPGNFFDEGGFKVTTKIKYYQGPIPKGFILKQGDLIVAMTEQAEGLLGSAAFVPESKKYLHNQRLGLVLISKEYELDKKYLYYLFNTSIIRKQIRASANGAKVRHTSPDRIYKCKINLPTLPIQQKIAAILSAYDDLIENNNRRIALLEKAAEEIYREWFVRMRFPGWEQAMFIKGVPEGWLVEKLGEIIKLTMGQSPKSEFYNENGEGLPFHQGVGTYGDRFPNHRVFCSVPGRMAKKGDVLFSVRAPVGRLNLANRDLIIGRGLAAMRHKENKNSYLFYLLKNQFSREDVIGNGAIFASVSKDELTKFKILSPTKPLISSFNEIVAKIDAQIQCIYEINTCLRKSRDMLLPRLISGKISLENLDISFPPSMTAE